MSTSTDLANNPGAVSSYAAQVQGITKHYGSVEAVRGVDLNIEAGSFTAIMGASGSGKSTLMNTLAGLDQPDSGSVHVGSQNLYDLNDGALTRFRRQQIGIVFQAYNLVPVLSALENVALPLILDGVKKAEAHQRAHERLSVVGLAPVPRIGPINYLVENSSG